MKILKVLLIMMVVRAAAEPQDRCGNETRRVRIYIIDRSAPNRSWEDTVAVLTLAHTSGRGETFLFPRVADSSPPPNESAPGLIRGVIASPYFVELSLGGTVPVPRQGELVEQEPAAGPAKANSPAPEPPLSPQEILRRSHQGVCFARSIPESSLADPWTATITIRLENLTFISEEFQSPRLAHDSPEEAAARADRLLQELRRLAAESAGFMAMRPVVVGLMRELSKLAPSGFLDPTRAVEKDRQWCLALTRAMEVSCYQGDFGRIQELSIHCGPRLKEMQALLAHSKEKMSKPADPEVPPWEAK
jgi:hypothetical protein